MRRLAVLVGFLACVFLVQGAGSPRAEAADWTKLMQTIARTYREYDRADRYYRFSPFDCMMRPIRIPELHVSKSNDLATHGRKLYTVFAKWQRWEGSDHANRYPH